MKVYVIGHTEPWLFHEGDMPGKACNSRFEQRYMDDTYGHGYHGGHVLEFAGRLCYESWDMPNPETATHEGYIRNIIKQGHESVLEHASVTFYVEGVSRNLSHELIRHRHLSFSELSQRYVDVSDMDVINPPAIREHEYKGEWGEVKQPIRGTEYGEYYQEAYNDLREDGKSRKQAREAARFYLPSGMETKFVVTGNLRAWRDVLKKRHSVYADAEMQLFAEELHEQLSEMYPHVFADIKKDGIDG